MDTGDSLDEEIAQVRSQKVEELTKRRRLISKTLLNSTNIQNQLKNARVQNASGDGFQGIPDEDPLSTTSSTNTSQSTDITHLTNMHRLSFTITTFPFADPSPNSHTALNGRLLGIRFDRCSRLGTFKVPYYILLRRAEANGNEWCVHRHTIPAFIPLSRLEETYLPLRDDENQDALIENEGNRDGLERKQDLHGFVHKVRYELTSWNLRWEALDLLKEELQLTPLPAHSSAKPHPHRADVDGKRNEGSQDDEDDGDRSDGEEGDTVMSGDATTSPRQGLYGISSIEPTSFEARQARITWTDGTIGRIKISNRGLVERAVVVGESGRIRGVENLLVDGESRIEHLLSKLRVLVGEGGNG